MILSAKQQTVALIVFQSFRKEGWTRAQVMGLVAMAVGESSLNPRAVGDHDRAFGLWQDQVPRDAAIKVALGIDMRTASVEDQCRAVNWELLNPEREAGEKLADAKTPADAARALVIYYERPRDKASAVTKRSEYAVALDAMPIFVEVAA